MRNQYQRIIDHIRVARIALNLNASRSKITDHIHHAIACAIAHLWIESELYTVLEMLEDESIPLSDTDVILVELVNELRHM